MSCLLFVSWCLVDCTWQYIDFLRYTRFRYMASRLCVYIVCCLLHCRIRESLLNVMVQESEWVLCYILLFLLCLYHRWGYRLEKADERLGDLTQRYIREPLVVRDRVGRPLVVYCYSLCSGNALLGDLLGVTRSVEHDFLSLTLSCRFILRFSWVSLLYIVSY